MRPYSPAYAPFAWRGWFDFGCGALGDMACHILGAPNLALKLGNPTSVECVMKEGTSGFMFPKKSVIRYDFPARGSMPPVKLFWYDGLKETPKIPGVPEGELLGDILRRQPNQEGGRGGGRGRAGQPSAGGPQGGVFTWQEEAPYQPARVADGSLFIGEKGMITTGTYGENTRLVP